MIWFDWCGNCRTRTLMTGFEGDSPRCAACTPLTHCENCDRATPAASLFDGWCMGCHAAARDAVEAAATAEATW